MGPPPVPDSLKQRLNEDVKSAMRASDKRRVGALRLILAAIKQREVDERVMLGDAEVTKVLEKLAKQRKESLQIYQQAGRLDLAEQESFELGLVSAYLPAPLPEAEIAALVDDAIARAGAKKEGDLGKVMAVLKETLGGRCDLSGISKMARRRLAG